MTVRPTSRFSSAGLALLAPAAERRRWADQMSGRVKMIGNHLGASTVASRGIVRATSGVLVAVLVLALAAPVAQAQPPAKVFTIGYLSHSSGISQNEEALRQGLREVGYVEGQNLVIEWRFAKGDLSLHPKLAAGLVGLKVDCLLTVGVSPTRAAKEATRTIPIVMANASDDPVRQGLVASLARPGGNVTGFTDAAADLAGKRLALLMETVPTAKRVAILGHGSPAGTAQFTQFKATEAAALRLGVPLKSLPVRGPEDLKPAFHAARASGADALIVVSFGFVVNHKEQIAELAIRHRLPVMTTVPSMVEAGRLMSYAPDFLDHYRRRVPRYVDRILRGATPGDLPVEQPMKLELLINLKTAAALGVTIPPSVLLRADRVLESSTASQGDAMTKEPGAWSPDVEPPNITVDLTSASRCSAGAGHRARSAEMPTFGVPPGG